MAKKQKSDADLVRFVWKRDDRHDFTLLYETESRNPFAFNNQRPVWVEIAKKLQEGPLKMKVTDRSCRERVTELLKNHQSEESFSSRASGISEAEMSEFKRLITSVSKLEKTKPNKQLKNLYSKKDRAEGEAIRVNVIQDLQLREEIEEREFLNSIDENGDPKSKDENKDDDGEDEDFEFGPSKKRRFNKPNPKKELLSFLEKKSTAENNLRKEELRVREKELENKTKELGIMQMKAEAEIEERKKITDLLVKLATSTQKE